MAQKILVTTDFSVNSKAGIRFAIQLASQHSFSLVFFHVVELLIPSKWNEVKPAIHLDETLKVESDRLRTFVEGVYSELKVRRRRYECVVRYGAPVSSSVVGYALECKASFICMGTRGAGRVRRVIGTHTSAVIKRSPIPVFAVPKNYRRVPVTRMLYASDYSDLKRELDKVKSLAVKFKATVSVLHYDYFLELREAHAQFEEYSARYQSRNVTFHLQKFDWEKSLASHIKKAIRQFNPSVVVFFRRARKSWYQRIFLASKSADVSYETRRPLLVIPKT